MPQSASTLSNNYFRIMPAPRMWKTTNFQAVSVSFILKFSRVQRICGSSTITDHQAICPSSTREIAHFRTKNMEENQEIRRQLWGGAPILTSTEALILRDKRTRPCPRSSVLSRFSISNTLRATNTWTPNKQTLNSTSATYSAAWRSIQTTKTQRKVCKTTGTTQVAWTGRGLQSLRCSRTTNRNS